MCRFITKTGILFSAFFWTNFLVQASSSKAESDVSNYFMPAAYFEGGNRTGLTELRERIKNDDPTLTEFERAIARAANKTGYIHWPECEKGGNASLVRINGRDAVITSLHEFFTDSTGKPKGDCEEQNFDRAVYYLNGSYLNMSFGEPSEAILETVPLIDAPVFSYFGARLAMKRDWAVFFLAEQVSTAIAPDGQLRGSFELVTLDNATMNSQSVLIGFDPWFDKTYGRQASFEVCDSVSNNTNGILFHSCGTGPGSSSSMLGVFQNDEIRIAGIHSETAWATDNMSFALTQRPDDYLDWNRALLLSEVAHQLGVLGHEIE